MSELRISNFYDSEAPGPVILDGSFLEGGGQILRISSALSAILGIPIKIHSIRAGRSSPGLRPQHLTSLKLTRDITNGTLKGDTLGSTEIAFVPGKIVGGEYSVDIKTAGSITLIIQAVLPCMLFGSVKSFLKVKGGTNVGMAPMIDYTNEIFHAVAKHFGVDFSCKIVKRGFYPKGGGEVHLKVNPVVSLHAAVLDKPQDVKSVRGLSFVAGTIPIRVANEMRDSATRYLHSTLGDLPVQIESFKDNNSFGNGTAILLAAETNDGFILGGSGLGQPKIAAFQVGEHAAKEIIESSQRKVCVDQFAQDQVIIFMALAKGTSRILVGPLTLHTQTAIHVTSQLTGAKFNVIDMKTQPETFIIECQGIGFINHQFTSQ